MPHRPPTPSIRAVALVAVAAAAASAADIDLGVAGNLQIHGFASQGALKSSGNNYLAPDSKRGTADFNEFGLAVSDRVNDQLTVGMQLFARDLGTAGKDEVTLDWAYGDYHWQDALALRAGKIRVPLGLYNESRDIDLARTEILLPQVLIYNESFRDVLDAFNGAEIYGNLAAHGAGSVDYTAFGGGMQVPAENSIKSKFGDGGTFSVTSLDIKDLWGGQLTWNVPVPGLRLGGSYYHTDWSFTGAVNAPTPFGIVALPTVSDNKTDIEVASAEYTWKDLLIASEFNHAHSTLVDRLSFVPRLSVKQDGWYVLAGWRFTKWMAVAGSFTTGRSYSNTTSAPEVNYQKDTALSVRFDPDPHWLLKLEGHYLVGDSELLRADNPQSVDAGGGFHPEQHWWMAAAKTTFSF
jgi:hypothetical protein